MGDEYLLRQFERILEHDDLLDELGFIHPSQFASLNEGLDATAFEISNRTPSDFDALNYDETAFWTKDHKLAISTEILTQLSKAARRAYFDVRSGYKDSISVNMNANRSDSVTSRGSSIELLENNLLMHSKAILILSCDFLSAWNSRKQVLQRKCNLSLFMDELQLLTLILSYSPKSECAWSHRRWVIKRIAEKCQDLQEIIDEESDLARNIVEKSKMNYRAWNHRVWLTNYMTRKQVLTHIQILDELDKSRKWSELHIADSCSFHYRGRLLLRLLENSYRRQEEEASSSFMSNIPFLWEEEIKWNKFLIKRFMDRQSLWVYRRFLIQCWIKLFRDDCLHARQLHKDHQNGSLELHTDHQNSCVLLDLFWAKELEFLCECLNTPVDEFEDYHIQAQLAASYMLWITKQFPFLANSKHQERISELGDLKAILIKTCPDKTLLWRSLSD
ncbi:uncharacterized protein LOC109723949 isoform X1 [Ananas comosus]|uniref:Uncharacterized protein LOC109723949 isoform X1 n=1 Tax=Ananas comosus TaxID=4615 RepID=A0A6P5GRI6_ANACO|nr:uncharacterized protein LOC109723949 isoform X1 [Ananas comosus]XP_020108075.1 uncharacterized protein LOC109723949 isoform X1 [Ananas comosus]